MTTPLRGTGELYGDVLAGNARMLALAKATHFKAEYLPGSDTVRVSMRL